MKYLQENEVDVQHAKAALVFAKLIYSSYVNSDKAHGVNYSPMFSYFFKNKGSNFYQLIPQKHIRAVSEKVYLDYCNDPKTLKDKIKKHKELDKELFRIWKDYIKNKSLLKTYKSITSIIGEWWLFGVIGEDKGEVIVQEVIPRFAKRHNLNTQEAKEIMMILAHPENQTVLNLERRDFLNICLAARRNKIPQKLIAGYIKKYFYFRTDFYEAKEITPEYLMEKAKEENGDILKEIRVADNNFKKIREEKGKILKKFKLTKEDKKDIYFSQTISEWFDRRKIGTMIQCYYLYSLLADIAKRYNVEYHDLAFSGHEELKRFLEGGDLNKEEIEKRNKGVFYAFEKGKEASIFYEGASELIDLAIQPKEKELKGQVASTGRLREITGNVRVVNNPGQDEFNQGDILVTSMTRIEFVPLMRKAKAIITNEGGIACHAAIVSRELGIPCIIGTKTATKQLKTGDNIKMDLEKGIINKI